MRAILFIPVMTALLFPCRRAFAASAGNSAGQILKLGGGARHAAVGDAGTAFSGDSSVIFWNPAGLGFAGRCSVTTSRSFLFQSVNYSAVSAACPAGRFGSFAAGWQLLDYGKIPSLDNTGAVDGSFSPSDTVFSGSWGGEIARNISFGVTTKRLFVKIDNRGAAYAADAGVLARFSVISVGAAVRNAARKIKINETAESLPRILKIGAAADLNDFSLIMDAGSSKDASWLSGGVEYSFLQDGADSPVRLRAGYSTRMKTGGYNITAGLGIRDRSWAMDYALVPYGDFGLTHQFSLAFAFGRSVRAEERGTPKKTGPFRNKPGAQSDEFILLPGDSLPKALKP
jgi:hypothetical protein